MSALNSFLAKGKKKKKKGSKPLSAASAPAPSAAAPKPRAAAAPVPAASWSATSVREPERVSASGWVEHTTQQTVLRSKKVADLSELTYDDEFEDDADMAEKEDARTALLKARRRAQRKEEKAALAAKAKADGTVTEEKKPVKKTGAYRPWAAIRAEQQAAQRQGKPPKIDDEASFPSLGGGATPTAAAAAPASAWGGGAEDFAELGEDSSDDEGPPALEPVGAHIRRAEAAKKAAEAAAAAGLEVGEGGDVDLETKEMSETAFSNKVENMISDFQDTHMFTDVTERLSEIEDIVAMSRRAIVPKQAIIMGIWGSSKDRECINLLLPKLLEANVLDRPTLRAGVESVFAELDDLCLDEPMTPKFIGEMIKKIHFRSVIPTSSCPKPVQDALNGTWTLPSPTPTGPSHSAPAPAPAPAPAAAPAPAPAAAEEPAAAPAAATASADEPVADPNAALFSAVKKKKKKKKKKKVVGE